MLCLAAHVPQSSTLTTIFDFIQGEQFKLAIYSPHRAPGDAWNRVSKPTTGSPIGATVYGCNKLVALLKGSEEVVQRRLTQSESIAAFCVEFKHLLEQQLLKAPNTVSRLSAPKLPSSSYYTRLLEELNEIGWDNVLQLSNELNHLTVRLLDSSSRCHPVEFVLHADYPTVAPICRHQLLARFEPKWTPKSTLSDLCTQFCAQFELYQDVWRVLDDFDANTVVLEPINPLKSDLTRRLQVSQFVSLRLEISAQNPLTIPIYSFQGAETTVSPLRDRIDKHIHEWDFRKTPRQNFETLAGITFPHPSSLSENVDTDPEHVCAICYSYLLEGSVPDQVCNNTSCAKDFHATCLYDWFQSVQPSNRLTKAVVWGACPYCEQKISVRNPNTR